MLHPCSHHGTNLNTSPASPAPNEALEQVRERVPRDDREGHGRLVVEGAQLPARVRGPARPEDGPPAPAPRDLAAGRGGVARAVGGGTEGLRPPSEGHDRVQLLRGPQSPRAPSPTSPSALSKDDARIKHETRAYTRDGDEDDQTHGGIVCSLAGAQEGRRKFQRRRRSSQRKVCTP